VVFCGFLLLVLVAVAFPELPPQVLQGLLWTGAGGLMILRPPEVRVPRSWGWLAVGFVVAAMAGFLPRAWFSVPPWRLELEALGLDTGSRVFVQPQQAVESVVGFAATAAVGMFLLGHRVGTRWHHRFLLMFAIGVGVWTAVALIFHEPGTRFGVFPNRNHSATLLAMGTFAGLGSLAQAIRFREAGKIALAIPPVGLCLFTLFAVSESRSGMVLAAVGFVAWIGFTGVRQLRGHAGRAVLLILAGFIGLFLIMDTEVKSRLTETAEQLDGIELPPLPTGPPELGVAGGPPPPVELPADGRITIYKDTFEMIWREPWTGVGPGQFAQVFPQYRAHTSADNNDRCLHPESDWLLMLAETGWPATLCVLAGVVLVCAAAIKRAWKSGARPLRMGSVVAAMLLCLHGVFDVPGHREGLAWAAILLVALALRPPRERDRQTESPAAPGPRLGWRGMGVVLLLAGVILLQAQWRGVPALPSITLHQLMEQARECRDADQAAYEQATAEGLDYEPPPGEDPLEMATARVGEALRVAPLDPSLHYSRAALALHYDDKAAVIKQAFAIQRRLEPGRVNLAMEQARAWLLQDPQQALAAWQDALRRAAVEEARRPGNRFGPSNVYREVLYAAGKDETLAAGTLTLAGKDPTLLGLWAALAPQGPVDREMPRLIPTLDAVADRRSLFKAWNKAGQNQAADDFAKAHPELGLGKP
jgi:O-antigen ligase